MSKKVSIIVPTYKRSDFLIRAIDSLLNQNYNNIEIVVVDDNGNNSRYRYETEQKMEKFKNNRSVIFIKNKRNMGGALARNEGISRASGDYITFLDDDDIYLPEKVSLQLEFMIKNDLDLSFTNVSIYNINNKLIDFREHPYVKDFSKQELLIKHLMHHLTPTGTYMFKKEAINKIGRFDDVQVGQEFMLMLKAIEQDLKIGYLPVSKVIQYVHPGERISVGQNKLNKEIELFNLKKKYFKYLTFRQRQYIKFRHHAVMLVVGIRSGKYYVTIEHLLKAIITSPVDCILELVKHIKKINQHKVEF
ncbi:glycosyltransferase family 2 protein [Lederbergia graminis]|uniref:Glycosyltransferase family 2 protein n=1 Tax=Lederbergia graminis TaxID=735518 RepID=A0ABW0LIH5_9BACI